MDVTSIFSELLSTNRGPNPDCPEKRRAPDYKLTANLESETLHVELTFLADCHYCCLEWSCHLGLSDGKRWTRLRNCFKNHGVDAPEKFELRLLCLVESGAKFFDMAKPDKNRRCWYAFRNSGEYEYEVQSTENADSSAG